MPVGIIGVHLRSNFMRLVQTGMARTLPEEAVVCQIQAKDSPPGLNASVSAWVGILPWLP
jgi:hypothetical protein